MSRLLVSEAAYARKITRVNYKAGTGASMSPRPLAACRISVCSRGDMLYRVEFVAPDDEQIGAITVEVHADRITGIFSSPHMREDVRSLSPEVRARIIEEIRRPTCLAPHQNDLSE